MSVDEKSPRSARARPVLFVHSTVAPGPTVITAGSSFVGWMSTFFVTAAAGAAEIKVAETKARATVPRRGIRASIRSGSQHVNAGAPGRRDYARTMTTKLNRGLDLLRPHPHRGDLIAAGCVPLTVAVVLLNVRMDRTWGDGIHLVITGLACALVLGMGLLARRENEHPRAYQTVLLLAGLTLLAVTLFRLAQVLGSDKPLESSSALFWTALIFTAVAAVPAWERINSPICALVEVLAGGVTLLAFVDLVFDPDGATTFRWILLLLI